jgi:hypothetical protein
MRIDRDPPEGFEADQPDVEVTLPKITGPSPTSPDRSEFYAYLTRGDCTWGVRLYRATNRFGNSLQTREIAVAAAWLLGLVHPPIDEPLAVMPYYGPKREQPAPVPLRPLEKPVALADLAAQGVHRVEAERQRVEEEVRSKQEGQRRLAIETERRRRETWKSLCEHLSKTWPADLLERLHLDSHPDFRGDFAPKDPSIEIRIRGFFGGPFDRSGADADHSALFGQLTHDEKGVFKVLGYRAWNQQGAYHETTDLAIALAWATGECKAPVPDALKS